MSTVPSDARFMDREDWQDLETCLATIIPTYERVNKAMSLGQVGRWRDHVQRHIQAGETVIELGSGPGQFAAGIPQARRILIDPLLPMQQAARDLLSAEADSTGSNGSAPASTTFAQALGTGEHVPLRGAIADHIVCAFSFRDFLDKRAGLDEMHRLLRSGGRFWILDVRKPPSWPMNALVGAHVRHVVPRLARAITPREVKRGWKGDPYEAFAKTYDAFGTPSVYADLAKDAGFVDVETRSLALGGAMLLTGRKA